jgi:hypothetical protein
MTEAAGAVKSIVPLARMRQSLPMFAPHRIISFSVVLLGLASCGPLPVYYNATRDQAHTSSDTLACQVKALNEAPVANEIRHRAPSYYPGTRHCSQGSCWSRPGYWVDGGSYTVDLNQGLRSRVEQSCMEQKGYSRVELPRCTKEQAAALQSQSARSSGLSKNGLSENACALRQKDGSTIILPRL